MPVSCENPAASPDGRPPVSPVSNEVPGLEVSEVRLPADELTPEDIREITSGVVKWWL